MMKILRVAFSYLSGIWRYRWIALVIAAITCAIGWFYVATLPDVYVSSARVLVDTDSLLKPLISESVVSTEESRRATMMARVLFSRENMEKLARKTDMALQTQTPEEMDALVKRLKSKLHLRQVGKNIYEISFQGNSPEFAARAVQSMLTIFVEPNPGATRQDQDSAEQSLQREIEDSERRVQEADREIEDFELRELEFVSSKGDYDQQLKSAKDQHEDAQEMLALARTRLEELQGKIKGVAAENDEIKAQQHEQQLQQSLEAVVAPQDAQIREMEAQVDSLLLKYTDLHPDVTALRRTVKRLKAERDAARAAFLSGQSAVGETEDFANPVYEEMRLRLSEAEAEVGGKEARVEDLGNKLVDLQHAVDQVLQLEDEQQQLTRDHATLAKNHASLLMRLEKARLTREADTSVGSVSFRTLDPPEVPREPSGPNRVGMSSAVFGGAIAAGIGIAFLISMLRPVFGGRRQLSEAVGVPVLGSVNMIWTPQQKTKRRVVNLAFMIGVLGLVGSFALVFSVFSSRIDVMSYFPL